MHPNPVKKSDCCHRKKAFTTNLTKNKGGYCCRKKAIKLQLAPSNALCLLWVVFVVVVVIVVVVVVIIVVSGSCGR